MSSVALVIFALVNGWATIHYNDVIMGAIASQINSLTTVYSIVYSGADKKKTSRLRVAGLCAGKSPGTGEFPAQMASYAENVSIWWRHHVSVYPSPEPVLTCFQIDNQNLIILKFETKYNIE